MSQFHILDSKLLNCYIGMPVLLSSIVCDSPAVGVRLVRRLPPAFPLGALFTDARGVL